MRALVVPVCYVSLSTVMAGHSRPKDGVAFARLCPAIQVLPAVKQDVDARHKTEHDEREAWS